MRIVITGAAGFIAANLATRLQKLDLVDIVGLTRACEPQYVNDALSQADFVYHLAGVNRPKDETEFASGNAEFTEELVKRLEAGGRGVPLVLASSTQAELDNPYGRSKRAAEHAVQAYGARTGAPVHVFRLTNVFGQGARPNYNSAVATFCHQVAHGQPLTIHSPAAPLRLVYIDDVVSAFTALLYKSFSSEGFAQVTPVHETSVGEVAQMLLGFAASRDGATQPRLATELARALFTTYLSHVPAVQAPCHRCPEHDPR